MLATFVLLLGLRLITGLLSKLGFVEGHLVLVPAFAFLTLAASHTG